MRVLLLLGIACVVTAQEPPAGLLNRWRTTVADKGGLGAIFEFRSGGVLFIRPGAVVDGGYSVEGSEIVLPPLRENGPPNRQTIDLKQPGKLRLLQGQQVSMDLTRVGKAPAGNPSIVGEWVGMRKMDGQNLEMQIFFYANGKSLFLLPFSTEQAYYIVEGARLKITLPDGKVSEGPFQLKGSSLQIPSVRSGTVTRLARY